MYIHVWTKSLKSIPSFETNSTFKKDRIPKQKKLHGQKTVAVARIIFWNRIPNFKCFLTTFSTVKTLKKVVTEKTVKNLNLNFKFLFNVKFRSWAFRNCAYFVMEPSGCDTIRLGV